MTNIEDVEINGFSAGPARVARQYACQDDVSINLAYHIDKPNLFLRSSSSPFVQPMASPRFRNFAIVHANFLGPPRNLHRRITTTGILFSSICWNGPWGLQGTRRGDPCKRMSQTPAEGCGLSDMWGFHFPSIVI